MCHQGGFNLHKFLSNSKEVINNIPESDRTEGVKEIDLDLDKLPLERTLGVQWCVESDSFEFNIVLQDKPCSRRRILSTVSSVYDPIGFVAPLMLQGKAILQELCGLNLDWDEPVPEEAKMKWERWRMELMKLQSILDVTSQATSVKSSEQNYITLATQVSKDMVSVATCALKMKRTMCTARL